MIQATIGEFITRIMGGVPMHLRVTEIDNGVIYCGKRDDGWAFDQRTGAEIDSFLGWGPSMSGSYVLSGTVPEDQLPRKDA